MKLTLAQLNPTIGDIQGNLRKVLDLLEQLPKDIDLLVLSELYICGYPPRDLLFRSGFMEMINQAIDTLVVASSKTPELGIIIGAPRFNCTKNGNDLINVALLIADGKILLEQAKALLPDYDVFDESRYFATADKHQGIDFKGQRLGLSICEDAWYSTDFFKHPLYPYDPISTLVKDNATLLINIAASPFHRQKQKIRYKLILDHVQRHEVTMVMLNQTGGNDELIFDGGSFVLSAKGEVLAQLPEFAEAVQTINIRSATPVQWRDESELVSIRDALTIGVRDYFAKVGASQALIGLSGGIDSALTTCIAVRALGANNVYAVTMPSLYSSAGSVDDSRELADRLGIDFSIVPINTLFSELKKTTAPLFGELAEDSTEENMQARIRGILLMALSNKFNRLVLATNNKSELAMGYTTMYGDTVGALAVIADLFKTLVYDLANFWNTDAQIIPQAILDKPPSAELRPNQKDIDSLPPYDVLDKILQMYIENNKSVDQIIGSGLLSQIVREVVNMVHKNEHKRRQVATVLRVTGKSFGFGRRVPVAAKFQC